MKVTYDCETDTLTIVFADAPVFESDEDKLGVILDASKRVTLPSRIEYEVAA